MSVPLLERWWRGLDGPGWRNFGKAIVALGGEPDVRPHLSMD